MGKGKAKKATTESVQTAQSSQVNRVKEEAVEPSLNVGDSSTTVKKERSDDLKDVVMGESPSVFNDRNTHTIVYESSRGLSQGLLNLTWVQKLVLKKLSPISEALLPCTVQVPQLNELQLIGCYPGLEQITFESPVLEILKIHTIGEYVDIPKVSVRHIEWYMEAYNEDTLMIGTKPLMTLCTTLETLKLQVKFGGIFQEATLYLETSQTTPLKTSRITLETEGKLVEMKNMIDLFNKWWGDCPRLSPTQQLKAFLERCKQK